VLLRVGFLPAEVMGAMEVDLWESLRESLWMRVLQASRCGGVPEALFSGEVGVVSVWRVRGNCGAGAAEVSCLHLHI